MVLSRTCSREAVSSRRSSSLLTPIAVTFFWLNCSWSKACSQFITCDYYRLQHCSLFSLKQIKVANSFTFCCNLSHIIFRLNIKESKSYHVARLLLLLHMSYTKFSSKCFQISYLPTEWWFGHQGYHLDSKTRSQAVAETADCTALVCINVSLSISTSYLLAHRARSRLFYSWHAV